MPRTERLMLLDTASMYFRAFFGVPEILAPDGTPVNAVRGLLDFISRLVEQYEPRDLVCCWDDDWRPQWRVDLVPTYKAHRVVEVVEVLASQVGLVVDRRQVTGEVVKDIGSHEFTIELHAEVAVPVTVEVQAEA
mgnify:CR=1 FL=1